MIVIPPPKDDEAPRGASRTFYLPVDLLSRLEAIQVATGHKKLSPVIRALLEDSVKRWEAEHTAER